MLHQPQYCDLGHISNCHGALGALDGGLLPQSRRFIPDRGTGGLRATLFYHRSVLVVKVQNEIRRWPLGRQRRSSVCRRDTKVINHQDSLLRRHTLSSKKSAREEGRSLERTRFSVPAKRTARRWLPSRQPPHTTHWTSPHAGAVIQLRWRRLPSPTCDS
jgi:hypothetical protein